MEVDDSNDSVTTIDSADTVATGSQLNPAIIKAKMLNKEYVISGKRGRSNVWNVFGKISNEIGEELENVVACRNCCNVYKFNNKSTSNLVRHKCYLMAKANNAKEMLKTEVNSDEKQNIVKICTQWAIENCRSFSIVEDSGLTKLIEYILTIGSKYGSHVNVDKLLPHPTTISRNIGNLYTIHTNNIKNELATIKDNGFGLTSDIWTDNYLRTSYMSLTIHYVKDGRLINRLLGLPSMRGEKCSSDNIRRKALKLLDEFGCSFNEKSTIVTDRCTNMVSAFRIYNRIYCVNHLLHNALEKSVNEISEVRDLCDASTKLVKFFKKSGTNSDINTSLKSFSSTRWNTVYYMLHSIEKNWVEIMNILEENNQIWMVDNININYIKALLKILQPFEESSRELEDENYPTLHLAFVHINNLKKTCITDTADENTIKKFKEKLSNMLDTVVLKNLSLYHKVALFLFPPANKLVYFNEDEKQKIKFECKNIMAKFINEICEQSNQSVSATMPSTQKAKLFTDFVQPIKFNSLDDKISKEFNAYENINVAYHDEFNVLQWWHLHQTELPLLYKVGCAIFAIPASSAASERTLSKARRLISEKYSAIGSNPISVNEIMFIHCNVDKDNLITNLI